jgi:hypothetical protein
LILLLLYALEVLAVDDFVVSRAGKSRYELIGDSLAYLIVLSSDSAFVEPDDGNSFLGLGVGVMTRHGENKQKEYEC